MNVDVVTEIEIARQVDVVAAYATDPANTPEWYANIESVEWQSSPPAEIGSRIEFVAHFLGRTLRYTYEIVDLLPNERLVMRTGQGPFPMETTYTWAPAAKLDHTLMTLRNRGTPTGFSILTAPLMKPAMRRANRHDLARLKAILESTTA